jgi:hypothetical protein
VAGQSQRHKHREDIDIFIHDPVWLVQLAAIKMRARAYRMEPWQLDDLRKERRVRENDPPPPDYGREALQTARRR